jgi:tetratricopeptide (TPR) repeat protein
LIDSRYSTVLRHTTILAALMVFSGCIPAGAQPPPGSGPTAQATQGPPKLPPALQKITDQFFAAVKLQSAKQYPEALAAYKEFVRAAIDAKANPGALLSAYSNMAMIYQATGDAKSYIELLHKINSMDPKNARALAQLALVESSEHHYDDAALYANKTLALKPTKDIESSVRFVLGSVAVYHKNYAVAEKQFGESTRLAPQNALAHFNYGLALAQEKRYDPALVQLEAADRLDPQNGHIHDYLVKLKTYMAGVKAHPTAGAVLTQYDEALKKDPKNAAALLGRAETLDKMGQLGDAVSAYLAAIAVSPNSYELHYNLARVYEDMRNFTPSRDNYSKAEQIAVKANDTSKAAMAISGLGHAELGEGEMLVDNVQRHAIFSAAEKDMTRAIEIAPKDKLSDFKLTLGRIQEAGGKFKEAGKTYRELIAVTPRDKTMPIYGRLAATFKSQLDIDGFVNVWKEYQQLNPDDPNSYEYIIDVYNQTKRYPEALAALKELQKRKITNSVRASALVIEGQDLVELNKPDEARVVFQAALDMKPSQLEPKYNMAEVAALDSEQLTALKAMAALYTKQNKFDEAIGYLTEEKKREAEVARKGDRPPNGEVYKSIAALYERAKHPDKAIAEYHAMATVLPNDPVPHEELGRLYEALNKTDEAAVQYRRAGQLNTTDPVPTLLRIGEMYQRVHMQDKAIVEFEALYKQNLKNIPVMQALALAYRQAHRDADALKIYDEVIKYNPALTWVQDNRAQCLITLRRYPEAEAVYLQEIDRNPRAGRETYSELRSAYDLQGHADAFLPFIKARYEKAPGNPTLMDVVYDEYRQHKDEAGGQAFILSIINKQTAILRGCLESYGNMLQKNGHKAESLDIFRRIAKENPKDINAWTSLADQMDFNGMHDAGDQVYLDLIARTDLQPPVRNNLRKKLGMRYIAENKLKDARALYQQLYDENAADVDTAVRLGDIMEKTDPTEDAIKYYQSLLANPKFELQVRVYVRNRLAAGYTKLNRKDEALAQLNEILKLVPNDAATVAAIKKLQASDSHPQAH